MANLFWFLVLLAVAAVSADDIKGVLPPQIANSDKKPASIPAVELTESKPLEVIENSKDLDREAVLQPIGPIFPSFLQPGQLFGFPDTTEDSQPKRGILTIILMKHKPSFESNSGSEDRLSIFPDGQLGQNMMQSADEKFKSLTQILINDLFGANLDQQENGDMKPMLRGKLLGGGDDPDHFFRFRENGNNGEFFRFVNGDDNSPIGDNMGVEVNHHGKNCNFMKYLKLKAHIHYRTIVHLVFISGTILMILMMISLTIKVHKRRNALRRYAHQNISVASIDSALAKQYEAEGKKYPGNQSSEQKMGLSMFIAPPPAYEQINDVQVEKKKSSLVKTLVQAYKNRYQRMAAESDDDRHSISSLPPYEEKPQSKN